MTWRVYKLERNCHRCVAINLILNAVCSRELLKFQSGSHFRRRARCWTTTFPSRSLATAASSPSPWCSTTTCRHSLRFRDVNHSLGTNNMKKFLFKNYDFDVQTSMCFESTSASTEVLHVNINLQVYVMRLATEVNWTDEEECFRTFCEETAKFYAVQPNIPNARSGKWKI